MNDPNGGPATPNKPSEDLRALVAQELAKLQNRQPDSTPSSVSYAPQQQVLDLDEQLADIDLSPRPVKIGGHTYRVRRDMTGPEVFALLDKVNESAEVEVITVLLGGDRAAGEQLNTYLDSIPFAQSQKYIARIGAIAGLPGMGVEMGEASAR